MAAHGMFTMARSSTIVIRYDGLWQWNWIAYGFYLLWMDYNCVSHLFWFLYYGWQRWAVSIEYLSLLRRHLTMDVLCFHATFHYGCLMCWNFREFLFSFSLSNVTNQDLAGWFQIIGIPNRMESLSFVFENREGLHWIEYVIYSH